MQVIMKEAQGTYITLQSAESCENKTYTLLYNCHVINTKPNIFALVQEHQC
jgi:hypothetical protein